jgi:hypothetical protein
MEKTKAMIVDLLCLDFATQERTYELLDLGEIVKHELKRVNTIPIEAK